MFNFLSCIIFIIFVKDNSLLTNIHFFSTDCVHFHFEQSGEITSENYGSQFYKPGIDCLYIIKPPKTVYKIEVVDLQMADDGDYIQVYFMIYYFFFVFWIVLKYPFTLR